MKISTFYARGTPTAAMYTDTITTPFRWLNVAKRKREGDFPSLGIMKKTMAILNPVQQKYHWPLAFCQGFHCLDSSVESQSQATGRGDHTHERRSHEGLFQFVCCFLCVSLNLDICYLRHATVTSPKNKEITKCQWFCMLFLNFEW